MIPFEITRPSALALLLVALPLLVLFFVRSLSDFPKFQRKLSLVIRCLIFLLLTLALAGFAWLQKTDDKYFIFLVDESTSISENGRAELDRVLTAAKESVGESRVAYLPFASSTGEVQPEFGDEKDEEVTADDEGETAEDEGEAAESEEVRIAGAEELAAQKETEQFRDGTNIAAAIEAAAGYLPPGYVPQIVLLSDGNETQGDALAAASQSRVPVSTIALPPRSEQEVQLSAVNVPAEVREGEPFMVEVVVQSNHDDEGLIEVFRGDHKVISEKKKLTTGENKFQFQQSIERERLAAYTVRISKLSSDTLLDNNIESGLVYAAGKPRVLIIESDPNLIRDLAYALEEEGIQADVRPPQGMPESLADLQNYELMILSNVPATKLTQQQMNIARTYVQELGGGFIMLGGEQSFGLGGYYKSALEEVLPVRSDFEKEKENPSLGMVLVIDKSGSMDGEPIEMAKSAARSATELLGKRDYIGVIAFDGDSFVISDMQSARNKGKISDEIARVDAGGGTNMYPAMELAYEMLSATSAKLKHCIVLTDGVSAPGDFEGLTQTMVSSKMTVSTVATGDGADLELLEAIARTGKGRHYHTSDPSQVPQIFAKETVTASKSAIDEQPFLPQVIRATHALADIDMESAPFLLGYVMTRPKPTSEVILSTEKGDPLLAWWRYGLGVTAAFTSDAKNRWAAEWMTWEGFGKFWTQVIRHTMRKSDARGIIVDVQRNGKRTTVNVDAVDEIGQFFNNADVELTLINPNLKRDEFNLEQTAPGRYRTEFDTDLSGAWHMEIALRKNDQVVYRQSRGLTVGYSDELRIRPTNEELLKGIAEASGGSFVSDAAELATAVESQTVSRPFPLWPWLVTVALCLLALDVALRRIDFSLHWPFRWFAGRGEEAIA